MVKTCKVVICGQAAVGKTAILEQLINGDHVVGSVSQKLEVILIFGTERNATEQTHSGN